MSKINFSGQKRVFEYLCVDGEDRWGWIVGLVSVKQDQATGLLPPVGGMLPTRISLTTTWTLLLSDRSASSLDSTFLSAQHASRSSHPTRTRALRTHRLYASLELCYVLSLFHFLDCRIANNQ